jgi:hypothetical protein
MREQLLFCQAPAGMVGREKRGLPERSFKQMPLCVIDGVRKIAFCCMSTIRQIQFVSFFPRSFTISRRDRRSLNSRKTHENSRSPENLRPQTLTEAFNISCSLCPNLHSNIFIIAASSTTINYDSMLLN